MSDGNDDSGFDNDADDSGFANDADDSGFTNDAARRLLRLTSLANVCIVSRYGNRG